MNNSYMDKSNVKDSTLNNSSNNSSLNKSSSKISSSKVFTIISHEYTTKVKNKGFIISTILGPLFIILLIAIPALVTIFSGDSSNKKIVIVDMTKGLGEKIAARDTSRYILRPGANEADLKSKILNKEIDGYFILDSIAVKSGEVRVITRGGGGLGFLESLQRNIGDVILKSRMEQVNADAELIKLVEKGVKIKTEQVGEGGETKKDNTTGNAVLGYILGLFIYIMMLMYGSYVMRGVIEEKANRIIEVIASSAKPFEIMMGKVIGIGMVGLTQVLIWIIAGLVLISFGVPVVEHMIAKPDTATLGVSAAQNPTIVSEIMPNISIGLALAFIFYFLGGYFIYSTLYAAVGSAVDQESDAQQLSLTITLPIILPILIIGNIISNPDGPLAVVSSIFPFFSPIIMIVRIASTDVPAWQIITSVVLLLVTFWGCVLAASKIYRIGILVYGKKPSLSEIVKWVRM